MEEKTMQAQINSMNDKLNIILEEIELQRRHRREMEDLKDDLTRVAKDLYLTTVTELEEVHDHMETGDMVFLAKKLLRNIRTISKGIEQLESIKDFIEDFAPISRETILDMMQKLDEYDRKGYFEFMRQIGNGLDNVVTSFTVEDAKNLGENLVTILNTVKNLTQPDMLNSVNNAVLVYKNLDFEVKGKVSLFSLLKELNSPEMKRGLAVAVGFLKNLANQPPQEEITNIKNIQTN